MDWLDAGNLVASSWVMGVAHPPGEPAWLALAKLAQLIPVGDLAFRLNLLSGACLAALVFPLARLAGAQRDDASALALIAAVLLSLAAQMQAVRAEVYAPVALILGAALAAALRLRGPRASAAVGFAVGLGAAVHPLLCAAAVPALALARFGSRDVRLRDVPWALGAGLWGFAAYAWLPLRALANPGRAWGVPDSPERFVDVLLARAFARNFGSDEASAFFDNLFVVGMLHGRAGLPFLALLGLFACVTLRGEKPAARSRLLALVALAWLVGNAWTILPQNKVLPTNPDLLGYLFVGLLGVIPVAAAALPRLGASGGVAVMLVAGLLAWDGMKAQRTDNWAPRAIAVGQSVGLPPGSLLVPSGNDTAFTWVYLQAVERRRADLVVVPRVLMGHAHEHARLGADPGLAALGLVWSPDLRADPVLQLATASRPAFVELREAEQPRLQRGELRRHGLVAAVGQGPPETAWLASVRTSALAELDDAEHDAEAAQVAVYLRLLWGDPL